jgi:hypothetical protein
MSSLNRRIGSFGGGPFASVDTMLVLSSICFLVSAAIRCFRVIVTTPDFLYQLVYSIERLFVLTLPI